MVNVLHAIDTTGPGGAETVFIELLNRLDNSNYRPVIVIRGAGWVQDELKRRGYEPYIVPAKGSFNLSYLMGLIEIIRKEKIDVIQSHLFGSNVYCCLAGAITRKPVIATFHGAVDFANERLLKQKFLILNLLARRIVVVSENLKSQLLARVALNLDKLCVIYNGVDIKRFSAFEHGGVLRSDLGLSATDILIGSIGNVRRPKAYDVLLRAAAMVKETHPSVRFIIAGENNNSLYKELLALRDELRLEQHVFFLGFRPDAEMLLNQFDIFLLSSTSEGFSISTIEAMACETPVVVTKSGGPEEIVTHGKDGLLVDVNSPESIAEALLELINNRERCRMLATNALETVRRRFSIDTMVNSYATLYEDALGKS